MSTTRNVAIDKQQASESMTIEADTALLFTLTEHVVVRSCVNAEREK